MVPMKGASEDPGCALKVISKENLSESTPKLFLQLVHWALTGKSEGGSRFSQAVSTSALGRQQSAKSGHSAPDTFILSLSLNQDLTHSAKRLMPSSSKYILVGAQSNADFLNKSAICSSSR